MKAESLVYIKVKETEVLSNHRGITYGDSIGDILEEAIDNHITAILPFTQSQVGGIKGTLTCYHVFIIRSIILLAITSKRNVFLTLYDNAKAYNHADVPIMLRVLWERRFKGKAWRVLKNMCENLKASIKTCHGVTRINK